MQERGCLSRLRGNRCRPEYLPVLLALSLLAIVKIRPPDLLPKVVKTASAADCRRAARARGSAIDDQLSSRRDWSKSKPGSTSQCRSGPDSSRGNSEGPPLGFSSDGTRDGMLSHFEDRSRHPGVGDRRQGPHPPPPACGAMQRIDLKDPLRINRLEVSSPRTREAPRAHSQHPSPWEQRSMLDLTAT